MTEVICYSNNAFRFRDYDTKESDYDTPLKSFSPEELMKLFSIPLIRKGHQLSPQRLFRDGYALTLWGNGIEESKYREQRREYTLAWRKRKREERARQMKDIERLTTLK